MMTEQGIHLLLGDDYGIEDSHNPKTTISYSQIMTIGDRQTNCAPAVESSFYRHNRHYEPWESLHFVQHQLRSVGIQNM
jgi:hypothetical protein